MGTSQQYSATSLQSPQWHDLTLIISVVFIGLLIGLGSRWLKRDCQEVRRRCWHHEKAFDRSFRFSVLRLVRPWPNGIGHSRSHRWHVEVGFGRANYERRHHTPVPPLRSPRKRFPHVPARWLHVCRPCKSRSTEVGGPSTYNA